MNQRWVAAPSLVAIMLFSCTGVDEEALRQEQAELLGFFEPGDTQARMEHFLGGEIRAQELIVECMAAAGFEYHPVAPLDDPRLEGMTEEEYRERYGWGMMSSWRASLLQNQSERDPNDELLQAMDEPTRIAWQEALYGSVETQLDADRREGCQAEADAQAYGYQQTDAWADLEPLLAEIPERIFSHPASIEAERQWAECMAGYGYRVQNEDDLLELFNDRFFDDWEASTPPPGEPPIEYRYKIEPWFVDTAAWDDLVSFELEMIAHDTACKQDDEVVVEIQEEFLDEHQELIRRYQAELEQLERGR